MVISDPDLPPRQIPSAPLAAARLLLRSSRAATLATAQGGQPHAALVTPVCRADGSVLLLLSELSRHTMQLRQNPHCALLCLGATTTGRSNNPQQWARLTLACTAAVDAAPTSRTRYLALQPAAALYADFQDFRIWRLQPNEVHVVAGFGQAWPVTSETFLPPEQAVYRAALAEASLAKQFSNHDAVFLQRVGQARTGIQGEWRLVGVDPDGGDLACAGGAIHVSWADTVWAALPPGGALSQVLGCMLS